MSDIFVSYASADRERAKVLADVLVERGFTVWWDRAIPPGRQFDEVIEEALDAARCVVVLWSQASTASTWVKTEAAEAMRRKVLIPAVIEKDVRIPLEFRRLQAADLSSWQGDRSDPQLLQFFQSIESEVKRAGEPQPIAPSNDTPQVEQPQRPPPPPKPQPHVPPPIAPTPRIEGKPKTRLSPALIGGIAALVIAIVGAGLYYERASSIERAEKVAQAKAAEEQARSEKERTEREAAARAAAERGRAGERKPAPQAAPGRAPQAVPQAGVLNLQWRDHALAFSGSLTWNPSSAVFRVAVADLRTGAPIGNYAVPAQIAQQGPMEYVVSGEFAVSGDSATPGPHTHTSRLLLRAQQDGSLRLLQNCPRPGECY